MAIVIALLLSAIPMPVFATGCWSFARPFPQDLQTLSPCMTAVGTVVGASGHMSPDHDFDVWIVPFGVSLDLLSNGGDTTNGQLQLDIPQACNTPVGGPCGTPLVPVPKVGDRIWVRGVWVHNIAHNWNAIDPVQALWVGAHRANT